MASADLRKELDCSICLNIYTDPVTLRCGHNFCRVCIDRVLDTQEGSGVYTCPECRAECQERPVLIGNITLCNIVGSFLSTQPDNEETGIFCTYCVDSPVPAAKSCLMCEASLCDKHLRVHSKSAEHVLYDPTTSLGNRKCSVHKKILEYYCTEDAACICVSCSLAGEHRGHQVDMLDVASEKKKEKLRNVLQKLTTKRADTEIRVQSLQERRREEQEKAAGVKERVTALFRDIRRQLKDLEKRVLSEISRQVECASLPVSDLIQQLEIKKEELSRKMRHIEELCNKSDPLTVLQEADTGDLCDTEDRERHDDQVHGVGDLDVGLISETLHTLYDITTDIKKGIYMQESTDISLGVSTAGNTESDVITGITRGNYVPEPADKVLDVNTSGNTESDIITGKIIGLYVHNSTDILMDVNTAGTHIYLDRNISVSWSDNNQNRPETPERFQHYNQVLSIRIFSSGRHYCHVNLNYSKWWSVGMCYPSIDRRGGQSYIGYNNKSWALCQGLYNKYSLIHDSKEIRLPDNIPCNAVGIYLDYEAGQLSFYAVHQAHTHHGTQTNFYRHLHTFTATFTEPLHAALCAGKECSKIFGNVRSWEK
ncbi:E3 ubiquitin/ISG15 ligase TRIM25-like [Mixophyes fleayi]|uniref:E3 ubiquitin/ISG15 ligase TRIM25-like n=1 Tax=Mixophyes fleayi TaxID=3061075 RepID=UPI003F4E1D11